MRGRKNRSDKMCEEENNVPKNVKVRQRERGKDDLAVQTLLLRKVQLKLK